MSSFKQFFLSTTFLLAGAAWALAAPPVIFDTDIGNDIDDALALAMIHALESRGECRLLGVTLTNGAASAVPYVRMLNRFYGRESIPLGEASRSWPKGANEAFLVAALKSAPAALKKADDAKGEPAVALLRRLLAASPEKVRIIQVGFSTNLMALLESKGDGISPLDGVTLMRQKVEFISVMGGNFAEDKPEYNILIDAAAARGLLERSPVPIVFSGYEIGLNLKYPATSIEKHYGYVGWHPVPESYRAYKKMPYDRATWDLTSVLYAIRPDEGYFDLSEPGQASVSQANLTPFTMKAGGLHRYLKTNAEQRARVLEALINLSSEPPHGR